MILSPVPAGLAGVVGPDGEPHQLLAASSVPVYAPAPESMVRPDVALPLMLLSLIVSLELVVV